MKLASRAIEGFLRRPDPAARAVLIYGPDAGLVRERGKRLARTVVDDLDDPFRAVELSAAQIQDDPARLADEAAAQSLTGGRRVLRITEAGDKFSKIAGGFLAQPAGDALVVVEAGDLSGRSSLRKLFEAASNAAALPCYADDGETLETVIEQVLHQAGLGIEPPALDYLKANLGGDRGVSRQELDKLVTYMGPAGGTVTLDAAEICVGDSAAIGLDDVCYAATAGDTTALERALGRCYLAGEAPIAILRAAQRHMQRLHLVAGQTAGGGAEMAIKRLRPPLHFKRTREFAAQLRLWPVGRLATALDILTEAEIDCKTTGAPDQALCRAALIRIAGAARAARR